MPWRISVWVCPPQTSMIVHGRVTVRAISSRRPRAIRSSRYSSTNLIAHSFRILRQVDALEVPHLGQERVLAGGLLLIHDRDREADVDHDVAVQPDLRRVLEARFATDPAEVDRPHPEPMLLEDLDHLAGDSQAHRATLRSSRWPRRPGRG